MKRLIEVPEAEAGFEAALHKPVLLMCSNYFYYGKLVGVNEASLELADPEIVYLTGEWKNAPKWEDSQKLPVDVLNVQIRAIESWATF